MPDWKSDSRSDGRPDWREEASRKLANSKLSAEEREEISRELAGYLEDLCSDAPARRLDDSAAAQTAAAELHEDKRLGAHLYRARKENPMYLNDRAKRFWLPGMAVLLASAALLAVFQLFGLRPYLTTISIHGGPTDPRAIYWPVIVYYPWLCILPFLAAAAAYWSRRGGSSDVAGGAAQFLSAFVFLGILMTVSQVACVLGGMIGEVPLGKTLIPEGIGVVVSWVVIPGAALLLGILPFLRASNSSQSVAEAHHA
ncbi:MAG TPA: hypothetical protein VKS20_12500 [Candidatus Acidoferrales bacterium]|nr:hypothetical protein [Candidatus Acidoferrales bacterium]